MKRSSYIYIILSITALVLITGFASYALFVQTSITNLSLYASTSNGISLTFDGNASLSLNINYSSMFGNNTTGVVASANATSNVTLNTAGNKKICCTYDVLWNWNSGAFYSLSPGASNELVVGVTGSVGGVAYSSPLMADSQVPGTSSSTNVVGQSTICNDDSGSLSSSVTQNLNLSIKLYNLGNVDQYKLKSSNINGNISYGNAVCEAITVAVPAKGSLINTDLNGDGTTETYRIIKNLDDDIVEIMLMNSTLAESLNNDEENYVYENSIIDNYLNNTLYNSYTSSVKNAIVDKTFKQDEWTINGTTNYYLNKSLISYTNDCETFDWCVQYWSKSFQKIAYVGEVGNSITRHIYMLSMQDIVDYFDATVASDYSVLGDYTNPSFSDEKLDYFFSSSGNNTPFYLLSQADDQMLGLEFDSGFDYYSGNTGLYFTTLDATFGWNFIPVMQIHLDQITWSYASSSPIPEEDDETITFTIFGDFGDEFIYTIPKGYNWYEFVSSEYNVELTNSDFVDYVFVVNEDTDTIDIGYIDGRTIYYEEGYIVSPDGYNSFGNEVIVDGATYYWNCC